MRSDSSLAEAELASLKSELVACRSQLHDIENRLSLRHAELEHLSALEHSEKLSSKVCH